MSTYKEKCMVPKRGHVGMFPANFCIKIDGKNGTTEFLNFPSIKGSCRRFLKFLEIAHLFY